MSENEFDRTARTWLEDGPTRMSDRALQAALDEVHVTRQRRLWWPARRFLAMNTPLRLAGATGAVAIVAALGIALAIRPGGGPGAVPSPTLTPSPTASPRLLTGETDHALPPGTYVTSNAFSVKVTFTVPAGWEASIGGPNFLEVGKPLGVSGAGFGVSIFDKVSVDPCHAATGFQTSLGPTVDDLAAAFTKVAGLNATTPTDVTFGGQRGKQLTITAPSSFGGCSTTPEGYLLWEMPLGGRYFMEPGELNTIRILDVGGQRLIVDAGEPANATAAQRATVQAVLDTVRLEPFN